MTKNEINEASASKLFKHVFGQHPGQTLQQFMDEIRSLRDDAKFVAEVRAHALNEATA